MLSLIKDLKYNISYCSRKTLINFNNDAASCYDRILPNVSSLIACKKGVYKSVTFVHANTSEEAKYRLKTALGVSEEYYTHWHVYPIYRSGQGATNSLQIWLIIGSTICNIYKERDQGVEFDGPDQA
eukprot:14868737-Ditylum_brightwellii.AAC.1